MIFDVEKRKPIPYKAIIGMGVIIAIQVVLGTALMITGVGATVGLAIVT